MRKPLGELFETKQALLASPLNFFDHYNQCSQKIVSVIGSQSAKVM